MTRRSRIAAFGSAALLELAGAAGVVILAGTVGQVIAFALIGAGLVLTRSLVFLEVGLSEDWNRERERERAKLQRAQRRRPRLARMCGRSRRLR